MTFLERSNCTYVPLSFLHPRLMVSLANYAFAKILVKSIEKDWQLAIFIEISLQHRVRTQSVVIKDKSTCPLIEILSPIDLELRVYSITA